MSVHISDINILLSQRQFRSLLGVVRSVSRVMEPKVLDSDTLETTRAASDHSRGLPSESKVDLSPELKISSWGGREETISIDLVVEVPTMRLQLFDSDAFSPSDYKDHGIVKMSLKNNSFRVKMLSDGAFELELVLKSITVKNVIVGKSKFREIIPPAEHDRNQFMLLYTSPGGNDAEAMLLVTVDSPRCIFAPDPLKALLDFFSHSSANANSVVEIPNGGSQEGSQQQLNMRIDLQDFTLTILASDNDPSTSAIRLYVHQMVMSHQVGLLRIYLRFLTCPQKILAISLSRLGMSLLQMDKSAEHVRFLDDLDLAISLDSHDSMKESRTEITIDSRPIVFRTSYRDIMVISTIGSRLLEAFGTYTASNGENANTPNSNKSENIHVFSEHPRAIITKEQVGALQVAVIRTLNLGS